MPVPVRSAAGLLLVLAAAAGCTSVHSNPGTPPRAATSARPSPTPTPTASDGNDLKACTDGDCEVLVTGPVKIPVHGGGMDSVKVKKIEASSVDLTAEVPGGSNGSGIGVGCTARFYVSGSAAGSSSLCPAGGAKVPPEKIRGVLSIQLVSVTKGSAILRLAAGEDGKPPGSIAPSMDVPSINPPQVPDFG